MQSTEYLSTRFLHAIPTLLCKLVGWQILQSRRILDNFASDDITIFLSCFLLSQKVRCIGINMNVYGLFSKSMLRSEEVQPKSRSIVTVKHWEKNSLIWIWIPFSFEFQAFQCIYCSSAYLESGHSTWALASCCGGTVMLVDPLNRQKWDAVKDDFDHFVYDMLSLYMLACRWS